MSCSTGMKAVVFVLLALFLNQASRGADTPAVYTGSSGANWNLGSNWSTSPTVPANSGGTTFAVTIPTSVSVNFDIPGSTSINTLTLNPNATLNLQAGDNLTVVNALTSAGVVIANGGNFTASGTISADGSSLYALNAVVSLPGLATYAPGGGNEFRADGVGAQLNLSGLTKIDFGAANNYVYINAYNGGVIDAHNLTTIAGTSGIGDPIRLQSFGAGSVVKFSALGSTADYLSLDIRDGGSVLWNNPTTVQGASISKTGATSVLNTTNISNADRSSLYALDGATLALPALKNFTPAGGTEFRSDGIGSTLDLSALLKIDLGAVNNYLYINAYNGGTIDAHSLTTLTGTSGIPTPIRVQSFENGSVVNFSSLASAPNFLSLDIRNGGSVLWGAPTTVQGALISKTGAASILNTSALSNVDSSSFYAITGAVMAFPALTKYTPGQGSELRADGTGAKLDFSALTKLDFGAANNYLYINAYNGGVIDAHNLTTFTGTSGIPTPLRIQVIGAGSTLSIAAPNTAPGYLSVDIRDGGQLLWGSPTTLQNDIISKSGAASVINTSALTNIDGSSLYAASGATMAFAALHTFTPASYSELRADGAGSSLDFSALNTIALGAANNFVYLEAYNGGSIDAHNLQNITGTSGVGMPLRFQGFTNGTINVSSLAYTSGILNLDLRDGSNFIWSNPATLDHDTISMTDGSTLDTSALTSYTNGNFTLNNATTNLAALANANGSSFYISGGTTLALPSLKSYTPASYSELRADGAGTKLDLSALTTFDLGAASNYVYLEGYSGGTIDAHNLTTIAGTSDVATSLRVQSYGAGSVVNLSNLVAGLPQRFSPSIATIDIHDGGVVQIKELGEAGQIFIGTGGSRLTVGGSLVLQSGGNLSMSDTSLLSVKRDFSFVLTDPNGVAASQGTLIFDGSGQQRIEAGGKDVALDTASLGADNFGFGRLIVGQTGQTPTIVAVRDDIDNAQRSPGTPESLYLYGPQGRTGSPQPTDPDAVDIQGGSTLLIRNLNVYAVQSGALVNLQTLIPAGQKIIPYKGGYLSRSFSAVPGAWNVDAAGDWNTAGNWLFSGVPNSAGAAAVFGDKITADRIITLNTVNTIGFLGFDGAKSYTISGTGGLNLTNTGGLRAQIQVNNDSGNAAHTVNVALNLQADLDLISYSSGVLNLAGPLNNPSAKTIIKDGPGLIAVSGTQNHAAGTQIITQGGTLRLDSDAGKNVTINQLGGTTLLTVTQHLAALKASGGATMLSPTGLKSLVLPAIPQFSGTGQLDLSTHNGLIVDYPAATPSPLADIRAQIIAGRNFAGTPWTGSGITSSTAAANPKVAVGYAQASSLLGPSGGTFLGEPVDGSAVLVRATVNGDSNLDGKTNFTDLVAVAQHYGLSGQTWQTGDFDYDQMVGFSDLVAVAQNYGGAVAAPIPGASPEFEQDLAAAFAQVPEPGALGILAIAAIFAMRRKR